MSKKVFTSQKIAVVILGKEFWVQALVSTYGAKYVFDQDSVPEDPEILLRSSVNIFYKGIAVRCRFVRETNAGGTIYNLKFIKPTGLLIRQIEKDLEGTGIPSPWMRRLPRLSTEVDHLPAPILATAAIGSRAFYMSVKNFTLGGLLLENSGNDIKEPALGTVMNLEVVTNRGATLYGISAVVTHVSTEVDEADESSVRFYLGVKFKGMLPVTESTYRNLIRDHCEGLRKNIRSANAS